MFDNGRCVSAPRLDLDWRGRGLVNYPSMEGLLDIRSIVFVRVRGQFSETANHPIGHLHSHEHMWIRCLPTEALPLQASRSSGPPSGVTTEMSCPPLDSPGGYSYPSRSILEHLAYRTHKP